MESEIERSTIRKLMLRVVSFAGLLYFFNWLDRTNLGFAAVQMNRELGFTPAVYGLGAGIFFAGFAIFEVPSNLILHKVGPRVWIARIVITWGMICMAFAGVQGVTTFYALRFLLGVAEAGFTPGMLIYLSSWFPQKYRGRAFALLFCTPLLAPIIGGPLSGWLMEATHGFAGLSGWRWMFLMEGGPTVVLGIATLFVMREGPREVKWLAEPERTWLVSALDAERETTGVAHGSVRAFLADRSLWAMFATYFFWSMSGYGIVFWLPLIIKNLADLTPFQIGLVNAIPFLFAIAGLTLVGRSSDRTGERKWHIVVFAAFSSLALFGAAVFGTASPILGLSLICIAAFCIWGQQAVFWTLPSAYLRGASAAAGIALVNTGAAVGGFVAPPTIGLIRQATGSFSLAVAALAITSMVVAMIVGVMHIPRQRPENGLTTGTSPTEGS